MDHGDIINLLKEYFYELIDRKKAEIHKNGPLPDSETWSLIEQLEYANKAIKDGSDTIIPGENIDDHLQPIIEWGGVVIASWTGGTNGRSSVRPNPSSVR